MPQTHAFWEDSSNMQHIKYESSNSNDDHPRLKDDKTMYSYCDGNLNFATGPCSEDESEYGSLHYKKNKVSRQDPLSHRIIEKRRRDRMNNCLADLSRLIPTEYLKKGRGRIEKTEIIEMAIQYMKHLQQLHASPTEHYRLGYQDCTSEAMRFLIEIEGHYPREPLCVRFLGHLQKHFETRSRSPIKETAAPEIFKPLQPQDYSHKSKDELNNNDLENMHEDYIACSRNCTENNIDRHADNNGSASYKYKTNIKLRFTQDTSAAKRPIVDENDDDMQQTSGTSIENLSSSNGSPAINYDLQRTTENMSPGNFIPRAYHFKIDLPRKHSPLPNGIQLLQENRLDLKNNFNIPIFVLHSKGAFYIPATIDYLTLVPFLQNFNILETVPNVPNVLHPVTINVNFQPFGSKYKSSFVQNNDWQ